MSKQGRWSDLDLLILIMALQADRRATEEDARFSDQEKQELISTRETLHASTTWLRHRRSPLVAR